MPAPLLRWVH